MNHQKSANTVANFVQLVKLVRIIVSLVQRIESIHQNVIAMQMPFVSNVK